jgi:hypothetical protein
LTLILIRDIQLNTKFKFPQIFQKQVFGVDSKLKKHNMKIERTPTEIIFRFPKNMGLDDLQDLTDLLEYQELTQNTKASQKDVDNLVKMVKKGRWDKTKQQLD